MPVIHFSFIPNGLSSCSSSKSSPKFKKAQRLLVPINRSENPNSGKNI